MRVPTRARRVKRRMQARLRWLRWRYLADPGLALSLDMDRDSDTVLLSFAGLTPFGRGVGFEFESVSRSIPVKRMFVSDPHQCWYQRGMSRGGTTFADLADSLDQLLKGSRVERLVAIGTSAGGYAALVFGTLLGADTVLAFAPQTVLHPDVLARWDDHRWDTQLRPMANKHMLEPSWVDLRAALPQARIGGTRYNIYFDETLRADRLHAERLRGLDGVHLYRFGHGGHSLVRELRDRGVLGRVLRNALGVSDAAVVEATQAGARPT